MRRRHRHIPTVGLLTLMVCLGTIACDSEPGAVTEPVQTRDDPPPVETAPPAAPTPTPEPEKPSCDLLRSSAQCPPPTTPGGDSCPAADRVVFVYDDNGIAATKGWKDYFGPEAVWNVEAQCSSGQENPLADRGVERCARLQAVGSKLESPYYDCRARIPVKQYRANRRTTPATAALSRLCKDLNGPDNTHDVVILAFDGVVDASTDEGTGSSQFARAVAACVSGGSSLSVASSPETYEYAYVFARPEFGRFGHATASWLASRFGERGSAYAVAPLHRLKPGWRARLADLHFERIDRPAPPTVRPELQAIDGDDRFTALRISEWLNETTADAEQFELRWEPSHNAWNEALPIGLRTRPPLLHRSTEKDSPLADCSSGPVRSLGRDHPDLLQVSRVDTGRATLSLARVLRPERGLGWAESGGIVHDAKPESLPDRRFKDAWRDAPERATAWSLRARGVSRAPCLASLEKAFHRVDEWSKDTPSSEAVEAVRQSGHCEPQLTTWLTSVEKTGFSEFDSVAAKAARASGRRVGIETWVRSVAAATDALLERDFSPCTLGSLTVSAP